jgi:hypothetical protein
MLTPHSWFSWCSTRQFLAAWLFTCPPWHLLFMIQNASNIGQSQKKKKVTISIELTAMIFIWVVPTSRVCIAQVRKGNTLAIIAAPLVRPTTRTHVVRFRYTHR